jgi:hypothetical protein
VVRAIQGVSIREDGAESHLLLRSEPNCNVPAPEEQSLLVATVSFAVHNAGHFLNIDFSVAFFYW